MKSEFINYNYQKIIFFIKKNIKEILVFIAVFLLGAFLRAYRINFGVPYQLNDDQDFIKPVFGYLNGDFNPHFFAHPGSTIMWLLYLAYSFLYLFQKTFGLVNKKLEFINLLSGNLVLQTVTARLITLAMSLLSLIVFYLFTRKFLDKKLALTALLFFVISPIHVYQSKFFRTDITMLFFLFLNFLMANKILQKPKTSYFITSGAIIALATSSKYPGILGIVITLPAYLLGCKKINYKTFINPKIILLLCSFLLTFTIINPFFFMDFSQAFKDINYEARTHQLGQESFSTLGNYYWYAAKAIPEAVGLPIALLSVLGIFTFIKTKKRNKNLTVLLFFSLSFFLFIGFLKLHWTRWIIPCLPGICVFAAMGFKDTIEFAKKMKVKKTFSLLKIFLFLMVIINPLYTSVKQNLEITGTTTNQLAKIWIEGKLPQNSKIAIEQQSVLDLKNYKTSYFTFLAKTNSVSYYENNDYDYLVTNSYLYDNFEKQSTIYPQYNSFYQELLGKEELVAEFKPKPLPENIFSFILERPLLSETISGDELRIYKLNMVKI